jgi:hypothetical protein
VPSASRVPKTAETISPASFRPPTADRGRGAPSQAPGPGAIRPARAGRAIVEAK